MKCKYDAKSDSLTLTKSPRACLHDRSSPPPFYDPAGMALLYEGRSVMGVKVLNFIGDHWTCDLGRMANTVALFTGVALADIGRALQAELC